MKTATTNTNIASALAAATAPTGKTHPLLADLPPAPPTLTARAARVLDSIEEAKGGQDANYVAFLDLITEKIRAAGDSPAILAEVQAVLTEVQASKEPCAKYVWCTETGDHFEHFSEHIAAPSPDHYGNQVLPFGLIDFSGTVTVGLLDLDLTPDEARVRIAELRAHLDVVEALVATAEDAR